MRLLLALQLISLAAIGAEDPTVPQDRPIFSPAGRKRLLENLERLETNIQTTQSNIRNSEKNFKTIENELRTLDAFVSEHAELRRKYNAYLSNAATQMKDHELKGRQLTQWELESRAAVAKGAQVEGATAAKREKTAREKWSEDAESKVARVKALVRGLEQNLRDIEARRGPLRTQMAEWARRHKEFQALLVTLGQRKAEMEQLAHRSAVKNPDEEN